MGFFEIAKPLFKATARSDKDPLEWEPEQEKAFKKIERLLTSAPALRLPDVTREFNLFVHEKNPTALGVLIQTVGPSSAQLQTCQSDWIQRPQGGRHASRQ